MMEFFEVMFRALTGLKLTFPSLVSIFVFFALGYLFSKFARNLGVFKGILVLVVGYIVATILSALLGVFTLAFILGFLSNQSVLLYHALIWAENLSEIWYSIQHRAAYEEIQSRERDLEAEIERLRQELRRQQNQIVPPDGRGPGSAKAKARSQQKTQGQQETHQKSADYKPKAHRNQADMGHCLKVLELEPGQDYTRKDIKKAYRRLAMIHHPDMPTGSQSAFVMLGVATEYLMQHVEA